MCSANSLADDARRQLSPDTNSGFPIAVLACATTRAPMEMAVTIRLRLPTGTEMGASTA